MAAKHKQWPTEVHCKMSIEVWENELKTYDLFKKFHFLLDGFENGFHQGIPVHVLNGMDYYYPPNHSSALQAREKIQKNTDKEVMAGRMFGPFPKEVARRNLGFFLTSPVGAVENGDKSLRPINDFSFPKGDPNIPSVKSFVNKDEFETSWDASKIVAKFLRNLDEDSRIGIFHWEGAYRQIPTHPSQWRYLAVLGFNDEVYIGTRISFGGVAGCGSFGGPADGWTELMKAKFNLINIFRWVDDNLCVKAISLPVSMMDIVRASAESGVKTNSTKYSEFDTHQSFIGFLWNIKDRTVGIHLSNS